MYNSETFMKNMQCPFSLTVKEILLASFKTLKISTSSLPALTNSRIRGAKDTYS